MRHALTLIPALLLALIMLAPLGVYAQAQQLVVDGNTLEKPLITIHVYANKTIQVTLTAEINKTTTKKITDNTTIEIQQDKTTYKHTYKAEPLNNKEKGTVTFEYITRGGYDNGNVTAKIDQVKYLPDVKLVANLTVTMYLKEGEPVYEMVYKISKYDIKTGKLLDTKTGKQVYDLRRFLVLEVLGLPGSQDFRVALLKTLYHSGNIRLVSFTRRVVGGSNFYIKNETYTVVGSASEYFKVYAEAHYNANIGNLITGHFVNAFMDRLVVPNCIVYDRVFFGGRGVLRVVFPAVRYYPGVFSDVKEFFMEGYNFTGGVPVVIVAGDGVEVSTTHTSLDNLDKVRVEFTAPATSTVGTASATTESPGVSSTQASTSPRHAVILTQGTGTTTPASPGTSTNTMLYGAIAVITATAIAVALALKHKKH